jgi:hypothetical protein
MKDAFERRRYTVPPRYQGKVSRSADEFSLEMSNIHQGGYYVEKVTLNGKVQPLWVAADSANGQVIIQFISGQHFVRRLLTGEVEIHLARRVQGD